MRSGYTITIYSVNKKPDEETATRFCRTRPPEKNMMMIFGDKCGILLTEYLPGETTISDSYYASIIERLRCTILEKRRGKGVLLLHGDAPIHRCNIVQTATRKAGFVELNHPAYSPDVAPSDYYLFLNLKRFLRLKNFSSDDEAVTTIEDYLTDLNSVFL